MNNENISSEKKAAFEKRLGCRFCDNGEYAEMSLDIKDYAEKTSPIDGVSFGFYSGDIEKLKAVVEQVDRDWVQYFDGDLCVFCGYIDGAPVSFCIIENDADCIISQSGVKIGSIGCVGTLPQFRKRGIGLRMVDLATVWLRDSGSDKSYIHYTHIDKWYSKLGYETFARFSFDK